MASENNGKNNEQVIRLDDILYIVIKYHKTMVGFAIIGLLVGILISFAFYVKGLAKLEYYVTASFAVTSVNEDGLFSANSSDPNAADIHLAEDITDAVIYVCKSDSTLNAAAENLQLIGVDADDIKPKLMLSQYESTQIIEMTLIWDNPDEGVLILNAIMDVVPDILISTLKIGDVTVVNPPKVRTNSLTFINVKIVAICFMLGIIISAGYYLVKHFIHPTYLHSEDVKAAYDLEILSEIPGDKNYFTQKINSFSANEFTSVQEYFSACAHVLVYRLQDIDNVCVYVTSSAAKEGKSSITANLGYALSSLGYKTLLFDMDVRNPSLASKFLFEKDERHCLNAVYRGDIDVKDAIVRINSNLDILPTRLEDERLRLDNTMVEIISSAKDDYDFVLIDTAPVGQVSDSMSLNQAADCALFVVRQDQVWINTVSESINRLRKSGIAILGAIMNDVRGGSNTYYYYNYKQFGDSPYVYMKDTDKKPRKNKNENEREHEHEHRHGHSHEHAHAHTMVDGANDNVVLAIKNKRSKNEKKNIPTIDEGVDEALAELVENETGEIIDHKQEELKETVETVVNETESVDETSKEEPSNEEDKE